MKEFIILGLFLFASSHVRGDELEGGALAIFKSSKDEKFAFHQPTYLVSGVEDLKLQFSFKYRTSRKVPLYFAFTELLFWDFYDESKPFRDINYRPELFYRLLEDENNFLTSLDIGYMHLSNGRDGEDSRSLERVFARVNLFTQLERHKLGVIFTAYKIFDDAQNDEIEEHLGYWESIFYLSHLFVIGKQYTDLEIRTYAGTDVVDISQGGVQIGLVHRFQSEDFNPSLYLQYFEGYAESLLNYTSKRSELRLGLMLSF